MNNWDIIANWAIPATILLIGNLCGVYYFIKTLRLVTERVDRTEAVAASDRVNFTLFRDQHEAFRHNTLEAIRRTPPESPREEMQDTLMRPWPELARGTLVRDRVPQQTLNFTSASNYEVGDQVWIEGVAYRCTGRTQDERIFSAVLERTTGPTPMHPPSEMAEAVSCIDTEDCLCHRCLTERRAETREPYCSEGGENCPCPRCQIGRIAAQREAAIERELSGLGYPIPVNLSLVEEQVIASLSADTCIHTGLDNCQCGFCLDARDSLVEHTMMPEPESEPESIVYTDDQGNEMCGRPLDEYRTDINGVPRLVERENPCRCRSCLERARELRCAEIVGDCGDPNCFNCAATRQGLPTVNVRVRQLNMDPPHREPITVTIPANSLAASLTAEQIAEMMRAGIPVSIEDVHRGIASLETVLTHGHERVVEHETVGVQALAARQERGLGKRLLDWLESRVDQFGRGGSHGGIGTRIYDVFRRGGHPTVPMPPQPTEGSRWPYRVLGTNSQGPGATGPVGAIGVTGPPGTLGLPGGQPTGSPGTRGFGGELDRIFSGTARPPKAKYIDDKYSEEHLSDDDDEKPD